MALLAPNSLSVARFLRNLAADPGLLEAFADDREAILEDLDLNADDREYLSSLSLEEVRAQLPGGEPNMGGAPTSEPSMGPKPAFEPKMGGSI